MIFSKVRKREMTLSDIQMVSLEILKHLDLFCQKNGINYSVGYGGLIGAVRHKGCIPWDDDIDVIMSRPDYDKFVRLYSDNDNYKLYAPEKGNCFFTISRLCEMKKTIVKKYYQWTDESTGVWIDIFPIDSVDNNYALIKRLNARCYAACRCRNLFSFQQSLRFNLRNLSCLLNYGLLDRGQCTEAYLNEIIKCNYDNAVKVGNYGSPYNTKDIFPKSVFDNYIRVPFEDIEVSIIAAYDTYLKSIYGDYMELPPPAKRVSKHSANKYNWL